VTIPIAEENIVSSKFSIVKNSEKGESFINDVSYAIKNINVKIVDGGLHFYFSLFFLVYFSFFFFFFFYF